MISAPAHARHLYMHNAKFSRKSCMKACLVSNTVLCFVPCRRQAVCFIVVVVTMQAPAVGLEALRSLVYILDLPGIDGGLYAAQHCPSPAACRHILGLLQRLDFCSGVTWQPQEGMTKGQAHRMSATPWAEKHWSPYVQGDPRHHMSQSAVL